MLHSQSKKFPLSNLTEHSCEIEEANGLFGSVEVSSEVWELFELVDVEVLMVNDEKEGSDTNTRK